MKRHLHSLSGVLGIWMLLPIILMQASTAAAVPSTQAEAVTAIIHVNVIPMDSERLLEDQIVIIRGDRIAEIGPAEQVTVPSGAQIIDGQGAFLLPGLADMHFHVNHDPVSLALAVANGVTTVQNLNALPEDIALAAQVAAGELFGPRIINGPHAAGLPPDFEFMFWRVNDSVRPFFSLQEYANSFRPYGFQVDAQSGRDFVLHVKEIGGDFIKTNLFIGREAFDAIVEAANELDMKVQGHVWGDIGLEHYIESGGQVHHVTEITPYLSENNPQGIPFQHYDMLHVDARLPGLIALMKENGMAFTPTVNLYWHLDQHFHDFEGLMAEPQLRYMPPGMVRGWQNPETNFVFVFFASEEIEETREYSGNMNAFQARLIRELHEAGVPILAGTDTTAAPGSVWGLTLHKELELFNEYGLTHYETLETATRKPAEFYDEAEEWGTVEVGKRADLLLLGANPLEDITNTRQILGVVLRGEWFPQETLQAKLDEILVAYEARFNVELEPYENSNLGISGLLPKGWNELEPGVYARSNPEEDPTLIVQLSSPGESAESLALSVLANFGVSELPAEPMDSYESAALAWSLYQLESPLAPMGLALAETDEAAYLVLLAAPGEEMDALAETVFFPAVDALTPIE